ncbi:MAG TPA: hypothetical protein VFK85_17020 [Anaeromyxobacteraceae bacterium]|nr:hypothetical protein [Anaeromyxobacteraceae bacterium]
MPKICKTLAPLGLALALGACGEGPSTQPAPLDRFTYPTGLALHTLGDGTRALIVVSSNSDLRYDVESGGSVMVVDPEVSSGDALAVRSAFPISSFGGAPAILSSRDESATAAVDPTCAQWPGSDEILVASRGANALYRLSLADDGTISCAADCRTVFGTDLIDTYAVAVACFDPGTGPVAQAYVTHLGSPNNVGVVSRFDLLSGSQASTSVQLAPTPTQDVVWDPARRRLYVTTRFATIGIAPMSWIDLAFPNVVLGTTDLNGFLRGADTRGIALAAPAPGTGFATRAYVAARVFDQDLALTFGARTPDVAGALMVLDITDDATGNPRARVTRIVPVGIGASQVHVLPLAGGRVSGEEIVAVSSDEGSIALYDATRGTIVRVLATASADTVAPGPFLPIDITDPRAPESAQRDPAAYRVGEKLFGDKPFALASEPMADGRIRLYVSSFDRGFVAEVRIDPAAPAAAQVFKRFGRRQP